MNTTLQPLTREERTIGEQFLEEAQLLRAASRDPDSAIAAAKWEKRLRNIIGPSQSESATEDDTLPLAAAADRH